LIYLILILIIIYNMNYIKNIYIKNIFIKIYQYITCVKSSAVSQTEIDELLEDMEYHIIYDK